MRVTVLQENLARGLGIVSKAVSPRSTLPVLANILIASDEGRLRLSAITWRILANSRLRATSALPKVVPGKRKGIEINPSKTRP